MSFKELLAVEFNRQLADANNAILIDVREEYEFEDQNIGGENIPMAQMLSRSNEFSKYTSIYLCCKSGKRSKAVAYHLSQLLNETPVFSMQGGLESHWNQK